jgi:hypothetical protein
VRIIACRSTNRRTSDPGKEGRQGDGFEHEGQRYRSLTVIAERITEAHWSGPRFFGLAKRACASAPAWADQ